MPGSLHALCRGRHLGQATPVVQCRGTLSLSRPSAPTPIALTAHRQDARGLALNPGKGRLPLLHSATQRQCGAVRFNGSGRDEYGLAPGGWAYEEPCEELSHRLQALRDATRNAAAVSEFIKVHEHCSGPEIDRLPDLLVVWNRDVNLSAFGSYDTG